MKRLDHDIAPARRDDLRMHALVGLSVTLVMFGGLAAWATNADLQGAVIASGVVVVETNLKKIQHPTGGVIGQINVKEGQEVQEGDLLVRLDETTTRANLLIVTNQLDQMYGRRARLEAERDGAIALTFPPQLIKAAQKDTEAARILAGEQNVFAARIAQRGGQKAQLRERIEQLRREIEGLESQRSAKEKEITLIRSELSGIEDLYKKSLVPITRVTILQREETRLEGERGALIAQAASARGRISETELQILNLDGDMRSEVTRDLRETESKIAEFNERRIAAEDQLRRVELRSPVAGMVHQLAVHTIGGVIQPGETLMQIVPGGDRLVIEAKVAPNDIEPVHAGAKAQVRLTSLNQRTTPELLGEVTQVAADLARDQQTGMSYFVVRIGLPQTEVEKLGSQRLVPGMPAEVFIQTAPRTAFSYLMKPITDQFARALRER
jgi:HlyD family secretion protein